MSGAVRPPLVLVPAARPLADEERRILCDAVLKGASMLEDGLGRPRDLRTRIPGLGGPRMASWDIHDGSLSMIEYHRTESETFSMMTSDGILIRVEQPSTRPVRGPARARRAVAARMRMAAGAMSAERSMSVDVAGLEEWLYRGPPGIFATAYSNGRPVDYLMESPYGAACLRIGVELAPRRVNAMYAGTHGSSVMVDARPGPGRIDVRILPVVGTIRHDVPVDPMAVLRTANAIRDAGSRMRR
jgi:hypothetical protein